MGLFIVHAEIAWKVYKTYLMSVKFRKSYLSRSDLP